MKPVLKEKPLAKGLAVVKAKALDPNERKTIYNKTWNKVRNEWLAKGADMEKAKQKGREAAQKAIRDAGF